MQVNLLYDLEPAAYGIAESVQMQSPDMKYACRMAIR